MKNVNQVSCDATAVILALMLDIFAEKIVYLFNATSRPPARIESFVCVTEICAWIQGCYTSTRHDVCLKYELERKCFAHCVES